jgi:hypothetical protein
MTNRRGMLIKNVSERPVEIHMATRTLKLKTGEIQLITAEEVRDDVLRENLQVRSVAIVRPTTPEEEEDFLKELNASN